MKHQKSQILIPFIIISNLFPLYGVLKFNWTIFSVVYIFWLEMLIVSTFLLLKILFSQGDSNATFTSKLILATKFFVFRTGIFFFYLLFIVVFLGFLVTGKEDFKNAGIFQTMTLQDPFYKITLLNFVAFNLLEFLVQFLAIGDYKKSKPIDNFVFRSKIRCVIQLVNRPSVFHFSIFVRYRIVGFFYNVCQLEHDTQNQTSSVMHDEKSE